MNSKEELTRFRGAKSRAQGQTFENQIDAACEYYKQIRTAAIDKTPEPMKVLFPLEGKAGQFVACFSKKAQPDYMGTLCTGRAVKFEAKSTRSGKMTQNRVTDEQAKYLNEHYIMGALCFVVVSFGTVFGCIPWKDWVYMKQIFGRKYITAEDIKGTSYEIKFNKRGVLAFLDGFSHE